MRMLRLMHNVLHTEFMGESLYTAVTVRFAQTCPHTVYSYPPYKHYTINDDLTSWYTQLYAVSYVSSFPVHSQVQSFFSRMKEYYSGMHIVEDEWFPNQTMCYVNLALADFRLGSQRAHEMFVQAVTEGVDNVYTYQTGKVECEAIPQLVKEHKLVILNGAPGVGKSTLARKVCQDVCRSPDCPWLQFNPRGVT